MLNTSHPTSEAKAERKGELSASKASDVDVFDQTLTSLRSGAGRAVATESLPCGSSVAFAAPQFDDDEPIDPAEDYWRKVDSDYLDYKENN